MGARELTAKLGSRYSFWNDLLKGNKSFGEKLARRIEEGLELPRGWLDEAGAEVPPIKPATPYPGTGSTSEPPDPVNTAGSNITHGPVKGGHTGALQYKGVSQVVANARVGDDGDFVEERFQDGQGGWVPSFADLPTYALRIKGDALSPVYDSDKILIVEPGTALANGEDIVIRWKDGRSSIRRLMFERKESLVVLPVLGGAPQTIDRDDIIEAHAVFGVVGASRWRPPHTSVAGSQPDLDILNMEPDDRAPPRERFLQAQTPPAKKGVK